MLSRAYCEIDERIRIARMKPLPKSVDVSEAIKRRRSKPSSYTEEPDNAPPLETPEPAAPHDELDPTA